MNLPDVPDYSPLSYGAGLALGLLMLLGLPRARAGTTAGA